ncbi:hypothetical protein GGU11DRAFT_743857 [Lentinula aff. detonsa]|nr:hypothetical protein GGU11DRAFT_743857 [Lentinula aff. detonsa]
MAFRLYPPPGNHPQNSSYSRMLNKSLLSLLCELSEIFSPMMRTLWASLLRAKGKPKYVGVAMELFPPLLGLQHITLEPSTTDGEIFDPLTSDVPSILGNGALIIAADGLQYGSRDALSEHGQSFFGLGTYFSTGASPKLELGALPQEITALHTAVTYTSEDASPLGTAIKKVTTGQMPLVVEVGNADAIATPIMLKREIEAVYGNTVRLTIAGAAESHLLAKELEDANTYGGDRGFTFTYG